MTKPAKSMKTYAPSTTSVGDACHLRAGEPVLSVDPVTGRAAVAAIGTKSLPYWATSSR